MQVENNHHKFVYFFKLFAWLFVGARAFSLEPPGALSCLYCVQSEELGINDVCISIVCKPNEIRCVAMQLTQIGLAFNKGCDSVV